MKLSDLYDADKRARDADARRLAAQKSIPHPLQNVAYADGASMCRHAKRHKPFQFCNQAVIGPEGPIDMSSPLSPLPVDDRAQLNARARARVWREGVEPTRSVAQTLPDTTSSHLADVDAIIAKTLHEAWLRIHLARLDDQHHARPALAYSRANAAKVKLGDVWNALGLDGRIFDEPVVKIN
ncbi:hypothetical protein OVA26_15970 [Microbacterium sp. SL62]|uniref:hypothetical protein n=1 Tax=Microbacterium sp. SL62 TaxID=2995139 RepID=UPI0022742E97|nr:hypothetical protein [Microbacterium sp. SL62]MCY1718432.1 hypothetical protein [Microbacterium sp. SL62]